MFPFNLYNNHMTFQYYINEILFDLLNKCYITYIDDILIYSINIEDHERYIKTILNRFHKTGLYIDIKKSEFPFIYTKLLDFSIILEDIAINPEMIGMICQ